MFSFPQHDPETEACAPGKPDGNFIMFDKATSGIEPNNDRFSPCSKDSIKENVNFKRNKKKDCFVNPKEPLCGNKIVEEGEECDCGNDNTCAEDCCIPANSDPSKKNPGQCSLRVKGGYVCSPSQGWLICDRQPLQLKCMIFRNLKLRNIFFPCINNTCLFFCIQDHAVAKCANMKDLQLYALSQMAAPKTHHAVAIHSAVILPNHLRMGPSVMRDVACVTQGNVLHLSVLDMAWSSVRVKWKVNFVICVARKQEEHVLQQNA